jgi:hypothetical protein
MGNDDHLILDNGSALTDQEKWVLEQVKLGEIADLKKQFGADEANRLLRAKFIEELLMDGFQGFTPHRRGIKIAHGIIAEPLDLENAEVGHIVAFLGCIFKQAVNLEVSIFTRHLILNGTEFQGPVNFIGADIKGLFKAECAQFQGHGREIIVNLNGMKVGQSVVFDGAVFQGPVDFGVIKVGHNACFDNVIFQGLVDFRGADCCGQFLARGARFEGQGEENKVSFGTIMVGQSAFFNSTLFNGPVDFRGADIRGQIVAEGAQFKGQGKENIVIFNGIKVGLSAFFNNAEFQGPVDFRGGEVDGEFWATGTHFGGQGEDNQAKFNGLKVGKHAFLDGVVFLTPVDFTLAHVTGSLSLKETTFHGPAIFPGVYIGGQFKAHQAQFKSKEGTNFEGLKVVMDTFFCCTEFAGPVDLNNAHLLDLRMCDSTIVEFNLKNTRIDRELRIGKTEIGTLTAKNLAVNGSAVLENMNFTEEIDLRDASFQSLDLLQVNWPAKPHRVWLEGLTYKAISAGDKFGDWRKLLDWVGGSRFNTQNYSQLEAYFTRCGHRDRADAVFITGKREASNRLTWGKKWLTRIFWGLLTGYGRKPWQVLYVIAPLVLLGAVLFSPEFGAKFMESHQYVNFFPRWILKGTLSLDRFLPGVNLGLAEHWQPQQLGVDIWLYWYALKIFGWITIPIALAAIYTRIK